MRVSRTTNRALPVRHEQHHLEGAVMTATLAWYFKSDLQWRDDLKKKLDLISPRPWQELDSDSGQDSISSKITSHGWLRIYEFGLGAFVANLTVEAETEQELAIQIEIAKRKTFDEIFASIGARDIDVREPYQR
jgi:hypothetical protein